MAVLRQLGIILVITFTGNFLQTMFHLPIPGNIIGMILLLILLMTSYIQVEQIETVARFLLDHLTFFFVPAGVGLITQFHTLNNYWGRFLLICLISTIIAMVVTGLTLQSLKALITKRRTAK